MIEYLMKFLTGKTKMKLNKRILKEIVKECLIEILAEGIITDTRDADTPQQKRMALKESITQRAEASDVSTPRQNFRKPSYLDNISFPSADSRSDSHKPQAAKAMNLTKDPIMNEIFADTAATTLKEQLAGESRRAPPPTARQDKAAAIVDQTPLDDLFGGAADKWASLAFSAPVAGK